MIPTTATKTLAERDVTQEADTALELPEHTTAVVQVLGRYAVNLSDDLTAAEAVLDEVIVRVRRTDAHLEPETLETHYEPAEFTALVVALSQAHIALYPTEESP